VAVEDELVLAADGVHERDEAGVVAGADDQHLLALAVLADVERRGREIRDQLRSRHREIGRGRAGLPEVLADGRTDEGLTELEQQQVAARREVPVLVEDAVVRQEALLVDGKDLAVGADGAAVEEVAVEDRAADERGDPLRLGSDRVERPPSLADEGGAKQQVLRRIARHRELGEEDEVGLRVSCLREAGEDAVAVAGEIADDRVDLSEREPHRFRLIV
jgi:hypothetical protein